MSDPLMRKVSTDVADVLDAIVASHVYAFNAPMFFSFAADLLGELSQDDCRAFAEEVALMQGYGPEDATEALDRLTEFRLKYFPDENETEGGDMNPDF